MTTIACNKEYMASDLQFTEGTRAWKGKAKIYKFSPHPRTYPVCDFMVGFAGSAGAIVSVAEFFTFPDLVKPPRVKNLGGLVLTANGDIFLFDDYDRWLASSEQYASIGTGGAIALGAMMSGADPKEAVKIASKYDIYSGHGIQTMKF